MKKTVIIIALSILSLASISAVMSFSGVGDREEERYEEEYESEAHEYGLFRGGWLESRADVRPVRDETYLSECGDCHFAYQPGLLPQRAWERIMESLDEHYGDDASLDETQAAKIRAYLLDNAADRADLSRSRAFATELETGDALPRITNTNYFRREHYEIPERFVQGNTEVGSFSNCEACHRSADTGVYNEHQVVIPGVGKWDD
ncbi:MAG: cytochrome C [bacterium]|nr:cytochrome C [bacterium]